MSLEVGAGEVVAIVGHNGSGKSTLVKILAGVYEADPGAVVEFCGADGEVHRGLVAARRGLHFIHQDLGLIDMLSTVENLGLHASAGRADLLPVRSGFERERALELISRFGTSFDLGLPVGQLSPAERAIVAVARAMDGWSGSDHVLVLDEPTTAFHRDEVQVLFDAVRFVASQQAGVVFVSHRLDEVLGLADRVVVLRDGQVVADQPASELDHDKMARLIAGRAVADAKTDHGWVVGDAEPVLVVDGLIGEKVRGLSFSVGPGEIVGVSGILGSGREELAGLLFGAQHRAGGRVEVSGEELVADDTIAAIDCGLAFVPGDRRRGGAVMEMSVQENLTLPLMRPLRRRFGRLDGRAERADTEQWMGTVALRPPDPNQLLKLFSGGNQQKVIIAKWLRTRPCVLLLDEPTQGIDVGAKAAIYELVVAAAKAGTGVLICSSDTKELALLCDRVLALESGRLHSEILRTDLSEARLVREELGIHAAESLAATVSTCNDPLHIGSETTDSPATGDGDTLTAHASAESPAGGGVLRGGETS